MKIERCASGLLKLMFVFSILASVGIYGQDIRVEVSPALTKCLPGVPVDLTITVTNAGKKDIWIAAESLRQGIEIKKKGYQGKKGETLDCDYFPPSVNLYYGPPISGHNPDHPLKVKVPFKAGETTRIYEAITPGSYCPVSRDITGLWKGEIEISIPVAEGDLESSVKRTVIVKDYQVEIQKLEGEDLAYLNAAKAWPNKPDPKVNYKGDYFYWHELFRPKIIPREEIERMLNQEFPGSTYAGYEMLKHGPGGSLSSASKMTLTQFDMMINNNSDAFSAAEKEERRRAAKLRYADFIKKARAFLATHPDFSPEALMRLKIANALFYTDKPQEAWIEVETLAMMEGQAADEARALLAERCQPPLPKKNPPID